MKPLLLLAATGLLVLGAAVLISGCATPHSALPNAGRVDLPRFMGTWYVLGYTPLWVDRGAHNAIEHYHLADAGRIETTYQFRQGSPAGPLKTLQPVGRVHDADTRAEWRMQFVWPFEADYVILELSPDYQRTIIAHPNRKYAWIMARTPEIAERHYEGMLDRLEAEGFDRAAIQKVPQDWSGEADRLRRIREAGASGRLATD